MDSSTVVPRRSTHSGRGAVLPNFGRRGERVRRSSTGRHAFFTLVDTVVRVVLVYIPSSFPPPRTPFIGPCPGITLSPGPTSDLKTVHSRSTIRDDGRVRHTRRLGVRPRSFPRSILFLLGRRGGHGQDLQGVRLVVHARVDDERSGVRDCGLVGRFQAGRLAGTRIDPPGSPIRGCTFPKPTFPRWHHRCRVV